MNLEAVFKLKPGDYAPDFSLPTGDGRILGLKDFRGKKYVILYFYPKDFTSGCTIEGCSFRDFYNQIKELDAEVLGVSLDDVDLHRAFSEKYNLPFPLLSDTDSKVAQAYGVLRPEGTSTRRVTFIIDKEGKISYIFPRVDVTKHTQEVIEVLKSLKS